MATSLSNYAMGLPEGGGEDFFTHDGTAKDVYGFPIYIKWLPTLQNLSGSFPRQPAAVYAVLPLNGVDAAQGVRGGRRQAAHGRLAAKSLDWP